MLSWTLPSKAAKIFVFFDIFLQLVIFRRTVIRRFSCALDRIPTRFRCWFPTATLAQSREKRGKTGWKKRLNFVFTSKRAATSFRGTSRRKLDDIHGGFDGKLRYGRITIFDSENRADPGVARFNHSRIKSVVGDGRREGDGRWWAVKFQFGSSRRNLPRRLIFPRFRCAGGRRRGVDYGGRGGGG